MLLQESVHKRIIHQQDVHLAFLNVRLYQVTHLIIAGVVVLNLFSKMTVH
jgi:hypothetical protein